MVKYEFRNSRILVVCDVTNYTKIQFFKLCKIAANNHNLTHFCTEASCCHKMKFFRNSIRNAPYSAPNFIEWFILKELDIKKVKYCSSHFKLFFFLIKLKKFIFFKVAMTIGENTLIKCLQCIKYENS